MNNHMIRASGRRVAAGLCAWLFLVAGPSLAGTPNPYPPLHIKIQAQRVPGTDTYFVEGRTAVPDQRNEGFTSNAGFVITGHGVVVFDALGTPALGKALIAAIRARTHEPIRYVVISHYHADHMYGLQAFRDETSAIVIAENKTRQYRDSMDAGKRLKQRQQALAPWVNAETRIVQPDITFEKDLRFTLGNKRFHLIYAGPAHAPGDSMMMVSPSGTLFAGDIVQNHRIPFMNSDDVNTANWLKGLMTVLKMKPQHIIPGHGEPSDDPKAAIVFTRDYIRFVRSKMKAAVQQWEPFDTAYTDVDWSHYRNLPAFRQTNRGNAYRVYLEMQSALLK